MGGVRQSAAAVVLALCSAHAFAAQAALRPMGPRPQDTEQWGPVPPIVAPGRTDSAPPSDAIILFSGSNLNQWVDTDTKGPAAWSVAHGRLTVAKGAGNIETRRRFRDFQLHLEWRVPANIGGSGQERGNSGVFLASTGAGDAGYELQILDSYRNPTYVNGQAGSLYKQARPLVNAMRRPGRWQSYDVIWSAPVFAPDGKVVAPARATVLHNGVLIQNSTALTGETTNVGQPHYRLYQTAPIKLQAHGDGSWPLSFRNIWVRPLAAPSP